MWVVRDKHGNYLITGKAYTFGRLDGAKSIFLQKSEAKAWASQMKKDYPNQGVKLLKFVVSEAEEQDF